MNPPAAPTPPPQQALEQQRYAALLDRGTQVGLFILVLGFIAYVSGWVTPHVALERLPDLWSLPVASYLEHTHTPTGWGWVGLLGHSDMMGLAGIAVLAGCSVPCLLALVPLYARRGDTAFVWVCLADAAVVILAASGWLTGGH